MSISKRFDAAKSAYGSGDFAKAKFFLDSVIDDVPGTPYGVGARYLRGRGYEDGCFPEGIDLQKAYEDFLVVREHSDSYGSDGILGCARILFEEDMPKNKDQVIALCDEAIRRDSNAKAMMLMGRVYEEATSESRTARKWYLKAFLRGLPWGMRFFARSHMQDNNYVRAILGHAMATVVSPFFVIIYGARSPLK